MGDIVNPYGNPYLPSFVTQRPTMNVSQPAPQMNLSGITYSQIHSANGFDGADKYAAGLANGASEIITDSDNNVSRVYVVAKDTNGQTYVQALKVIPEDRPKPITMEDLNSKMSILLDRIDKLEKDRVTNNESGNFNSSKNAKQSVSSGYRSDDRNSQNGSKPYGGTAE